MKRSILLAALALWSTPFGLFAQSPAPTPEKEPPPSPPLVALAPASSQWAITYAPKTPLKEPTTPDEIRNQKIRQRYSPIILGKRILKADGRMVIYTTLEAGMKSEAWVVGKYLCELPMRPGDDIRIEARGPGDFPELAWIKADNFRGTVSVKGRKAHLYEAAATDEGSDPAPPGAPRGNQGPNESGAAKATPQRVYIDAETRLPLFVDEGSAVATYQFSTSPPTLPVPDPRIQKIIEDSKTKPLPKGP